MTYGSFSSAFLLAAYQEAQGRPYDLTAGEVVDLYGLKPQQGWLRAAFDELARSGFIENDPTLGDGRDLAILFKGPGLREAERLLRAGNRIQPVAKKVATAPQPLSPAEPAVANVESVDSSRWTGLEQRAAADPTIVDRVSQHLVEIDKLVDASKLTNADKAKAKAISGALLSLIESPQPEWQAIVALLNSPALAAVLNVAALVQIILKILFGIG